MRDLIVAGNWKMNKTFDDGVGLVRDLTDVLTPEMIGRTKVVVSPPYVLLSDIVAELWENDTISVAAQNCHQNDNGAFTGEIAVPMLKSIEVDAVILGHSERRQYFGETDALIKEKVKNVLAHQMIPIFCCGESLEERKSNQHFEIVKSQIENALFNLDAEAFSNVVIAYEPVWAIGTGETASPEQAQEMHAHIRSVVQEKFSSTISDEISILYGGSCKPSNAKEIFSQPDVDGGLIGGASLNVDDFSAIVGAMKVKQ